MKRTILTILAVVALVTSLLPAIALANGKDSDGTEIEDNNVALAVQLAKAMQMAGQKQVGFNYSDQTEIAKLFNMPIQKADADADNYAKVLGASLALSVAKSGDVFSIGNITAVELKNMQYSDASANGDVKVINIAGDSKAFSFAKDAYAEGGDAEAKSGDSDNDVWSINKNAAISAMFKSGNAFASGSDCKDRDDHDGKDGKDSKDCDDGATAIGGDSEAKAGLWSKNSASGYNPADNSGNGGGAGASNWSQAVSGNGGDALIASSSIGNFGGVSANAFTANIGGQGTSTASSGDAYSGSADANVWNTLTQKAKAGTSQVQTSDPSIDQNESNTQDLTQKQGQIPVNAAIQILAQVLDSFKK